MYHRFEDNIISMEKLQHDLKARVVYYTIKLKYFGVFESIVKKYDGKIITKRLVTELKKHYPSSVNVHIDSRGAGSFLRKSIIISDYSAIDPHHPDSKLSMDIALNSFAPFSFKEFEQECTRFRDLEDKIKQLEKVISIQHYRRLVQKWNLALADMDEVHSAAALCGLEYDFILKR